MALLALLLGLFALTACGGDSGAPGETATPQATATAIATETPEPGPPVPEAARIVEHMRVLSQDIGIRLAGSGEAHKAATYAEQQFESWGYEVEQQAFSDSRPEVLTYARVIVQQPEEHFLHARVFRGSRPGSLSGQIIDAGTGQEAEFPAEARGAIVLIQRQDVLFTDMATRAKEHGAIGMLVANNREGMFRGTIEPPADLPAVSISQADGEALREQLGSGGVNLSIEVPPSIDGTNVIARPASGVCRTLSGAHYDTVPWAPGAIDNASGAAVVLELARATSVAKLTDHCFVLFSGEEEGLVGSAQFVTAMTQRERGDLVGYFNYDVVAGGAQINVVGDEALATRAIELGTQAGDDIVVAQLPSNASSDFASFLLSGLPAIMFTVDDLGVLHTEDDTFEFAQQHTEPLQPIADLGFALMQDVVRAPAP